MKEEIQDKFRQFYLEYKKTRDTFPEFPEETDFMLPEYQFGDAPKSTQQEPASAKEEKKADPKAKGKAEAAAGDDDPSLKLDVSVYIPKIKEVQKNYIEQWRDKDETNNFNQKHDQEIVKKEKRLEVEILVCRHDES